VETDELSDNKNQPLTCNAFYFYNDCYTVTRLLFGHYPSLSAYRLRYRNVLVALCDLSLRPLGAWGEATPI